MIGGRDISFPAGCAAEQCKSIVRVALAFWSDAVLEDAATGNVLERSGGGEIDLPQEVLIFRNADARESWHFQGAVPENENSLLHVFAGLDSATVVVDNPDNALIKRMLESIAHALNQK